MRSHAPAASRLLLVRDITQEAEIDRMKSEFLSTAAHELRTPMSSIHGFTELMLMHDFPPERRATLLAKVHRHSSAMVRILDELLDLARIEARRGARLRVSSRSTWPRWCGRRWATSPSLPGAAHRQLQAPAQPLWVRADRARLARVLGNLLSNAYKYSPAGGEVVLALAIDADRASLTVRDHGIGLAPEQLVRVLRTLLPGPTPAAAFPGTGLGMSIVQQIVEGHGGTLALASEPGQGTTVSVWLPLQPAPSGRAAGARRRHRLRRHRLIDKPQAPHE